MNELDVMKALADMDLPTRRRVLDWANSKWPACPNVLREPWNKVPCTCPVCYTESTRS